MAATVLNGCPSELDSIGNSTCITEPQLSMIQAIIPEVDSHSYSSLANFNDEDVNKTSIVSKGILPLKVFGEMEAANVEELTSNTSTGVKLFHANMKYGLIGAARLSPDQNRIVQSYDKKIKKVYLMDGQGTRLGTVAADGTSIEGLSVGYFHVIPMELPVAADGSAWSKIEIQLEYVSEINKTPRYSIGTELDWDPLKVLQPMTKLIVTPGTCATNTFNFTVAYVDPTTGKSETLSGADEDNFIVKDESGLVVTAVIVETAVPGTYTCTGTMVSGTIELIASVDSMRYSAVTAVAAD